MIYAVLALAASNAVVSGALIYSLQLSYQERRTLTAAALAVQGKPTAAAQAKAPTPTEDRKRFEAEAEMSRKIKEQAAPFSALNPFGR